MILFLTLLLTEGSLIYFVEVCRHGARAPVNFMPWDSLQRWPNGPKNLVNEGLRQQYLLGSYLRQRYIFEERFLSDTYNSTEIKAYSTSISRTIFSMESQLMGLYPQDDIYIDQIIFPSGPKEAKYPSKSPLIPIYLNEAKIEPMLLIEDYCKPYNDHVKARKSSPGFFKLFKKYPEVTSAVSSYFNITKEHSSGYFLNVLSSVTSNSFMDYQVPEVFDQSWEDEAQDLYLELRRYLRYGTEYARKLAASEFLNTLDEQFTAKIKGNTPLKATLYSAHDTTLMNIFHCLNYSLSIQPPFASVLLFELHRIQEEYFIKVIYNNAPLNLHFCRKVFCELRKFRAFLQGYTFKNATDACNNFPVFMKESEVKVHEVKEEVIEIVAEQLEEEEESSLLAVVSFFTILVIIALFYLIKKIPR